MAGRLPLLLSLAIALVAVLLADCSGAATRPTQEFVSENLALSREAMASAIRTPSSTATLGIALGDRQSASKAASSTPARDAAMEEAKVEAEIPPTEELPPQRRPVSLSRPRS
jgi:hypothetical protein